MIAGIDAHIHLDMYVASDVIRILSELPSEQVVGLIAVSRHWDSCQATYKLQQCYPTIVHAAFGFHPEQEIPDDEEIDKLVAWMIQHQKDTVAIGEVGLPYYLRQEAMELGKPFHLEPYVQLLERFVALSKQLDKPIILHAVYEDAEIACDLLEKYEVTSAHFHWFKGNSSTINRMALAGYSISITPDVIYEPSIQDLVKEYPLHLMMVETDGPWMFEGPFTEQPTHPDMIIEVIQRIAQIKQLPVEEVSSQLLLNTRQFYRLHK